MKKIIKLTEADLHRLVERILVEGPEHVEGLYRSWANKKSGNPEAALKIMDDVLKYQKRLPKKDFSKYSSYEELVSDLNKIKQSLKSEDATKLYEDKDLVVLAANTWEASCKYGAGTKWCTTAKDTSSYWRRHNETGTEFFWIFKNVPNSDPNHKFSYHIKIDGGSDWCNSVNTCMSKLPENSYPKTHPKYDEIIDKLQNFHNTREFKVKAQFSQDITNINFMFVNDLVRRNYDDIVQQIINHENIENLVKLIFSDAIYDFMDGAAGEIVPASVDVDEWDEDEEMRDAFFNGLERHINNSISSFDYTVSLDSLHRDLNWLVEDTLVRYLHLDRNLSFEEQMEERGITITDIINELDAEEVLSEVLSMDIMYFIEDVAWEFESGWKY